MTQNKKIDVNEEFDQLENKQWLYPLYLIRRIINKYGNKFFPKPNLNSLSLMLRVVPTIPISIMKFQKISQESEKEQDIINGKCNIKKEKKFLFDVVTEYNPSDEIFIENEQTNEENEIEYEEDISLDSYTLTISIDNLEHINIKLKDIIIIMFEKLENVVSTISEKVPISTIINLSFTYDKGNISKIEELKNELSNIRNIKASLFTSDKEDRLELLTKLTVLNQSLIRDTIFKKLK